MKPYLTPQEVADLMMVSPVTVRQWAKKGDLVAETTPGGHRRFLRDEVERFMEKNRITPQKHKSDEIRILIVDDDQQITGFLSEFLSMQAVKTIVELANDGFEAGQKVQTFKPDIVLLDLIMPGLDGFDVCRRIKQNPETSSVRVIAMTGFYTEESVRRVLQTGAEACIAKPLDKDKLIEAINLETIRSGSAEPE